jgi:virulence factor Mce-like protein
VSTAADNSVLVRRIALGAAAAIVVVVLVILLSSAADGGHRVRMTLPEATGLIAGFDVRMAGEPVGTVKSVELTPNYQAAVELSIDDTAWPLPADTRFRERLGGTIKYSDRYIEIVRGDDDAEIPENAILPASSFQSPVEFDDLFNTFDSPTRKGLDRTFRALGGAAPQVEKALPAALQHGPDAAESAESILAQLGDDPKALDALVRNTAAVTRSIADADPGLGDLITGANDTFVAVAGQSQDLARTLEEAPSTLAAATHTASRVDTTLRTARDLTTRLKPGVARLQRLARPLNHLLTSIVDVGPDARATLSTLGKATPDLNTLLTRARSPIMSQVEDISRQATPQLECIRPFSPEIAGLASTWAAFFGSGDNKDKFIRAQFGIHPTMNETPVNIETYKKLFPETSLDYAFPRPPGEIVDQPWFQPQCGITKDALDPSKDPEAQAIDPMSKKLIDFSLNEGPENGRNLP